MQPDEVASELKKQGLRDWYSGVVEQRLVPGGAMIVVMHRLAPDDFTATLLEKGGWFHVSLPLIAVQEITYTDRSDRDFGSASRAICSALAGPRHRQSRIFGAICPRKSSKGNISRIRSSAVLGFVQSTASRASRRGRPMS